MMIKKKELVALLIAIVLISFTIYSYNLDHTIVFTKVTTQTKTETLPLGPGLGRDIYVPNATLLCCIFNGTAFHNGTATSIVYQTETTTIPPPFYATLWPYILALSIIILGLAVLIFRRNYCMSKVMILLISLILISLAVFLHSTDKPIVHILVLSKVTCKNNYNQLAAFDYADAPLCEPKPPVIYQTVIILPPPWYAQLWFLPLTVGILLIFMLAYTCKAVTLKVLKVIIKYLEPILN